jgi:hypothetical protein
MGEWEFLGYAAVLVGVVYLLLDRVFHQCRCEDGDPVVLRRVVEEREQVADWLRQNGDDLARRAVSITDDREAHAQRTAAVAMTNAADMMAARTEDLRRAADAR